MQQYFLFFKKTFLDDALDSDDYIETLIKSEAKPPETKSSPALPPPNRPPITAIETFMDDENEKPPDETNDSKTTDWLPPFSDQSVNFNEYLRGIIEKTGWSTADVNRICSGEKSDAINKLLSFILFKTKWPVMLKSIIRQAGGHSLQDIEDSISEGLFALFKTLDKQAFRGDRQCQLKSYFFTICFRFWTRKAKNNWRISLIENFYNLNIPDHNTPENIFLREEQSTLLRKIVNLLGLPCRDLIGHWARGYSHAEIAVLFDLTDAEAAKKRVHKCRERLRDLIKMLGLNNRSF